MSGVSHGLPAPEGAARSHAERVREHLHAAIAAAGGWLDFADFMQLALYAPGLGYYSAGATKLGAAGDFVTAPETGALFGRCVARALLPTLEACTGAEILEPGAGSGALAESLLHELDARGTLPSAYRILEPSAELAARQRARLATLPPHLFALLRWEQAPPSDHGAGIVLANEVADALPVRRFRITARGIVPLGVASAGEGFEWREGTPDAALESGVRERLGPLLDALPEGYESEFSHMLPGWLAGVLGAYRRGLALVFDYGLPRAEYYAVQRHGGTLRCHYRHRAHSDPLVLAGLQDITAWVDFTTLADAALACDWAVAGFATQAHFLLDTGIAEFLADVPADGSVDRLRLQQQLRTLTMPGEMGERFRVLALTRGFEAPIPGFGFRDLRDRL